jgi:hypothetical protein
MRLFTLSLTLCLLLCGTACDHNPVRPGGSNGEYYFYGAALEGHHLLRFTPSTGEVDTLLTDDSLPLENFTLSADGKQLYQLNYDGLDLYRTDPFTRIRKMPFTGEVVCSPDGKYLANWRGGSKGVRVFRLPGFAEVDVKDTSGVFMSTAVFSHDSRTLFFVNETERDVVRPDARRGFKSLPRIKPAMPGSIVQVVPSVDERLWFLYSIWNTLGFSFGVYDVARDSLIYLTNFSSGAGSIVVSPDGKGAFYTTPGSLHFGTTPPSAFYFYDIATNSVREISTLGWSQIPGNDRTPVGPMAISPDGKTLVLLQSNVGAEVLTFDIPTQTITNCFFYDWSPMFYNIQCQNSN